MSVASPFGSKGRRLCSPPTIVGVPTVAGIPIVQVVPAVQCLHAVPSVPIVAGGSVMLATLLFLVSLCTQKLNELNYSATGLSDH